jgi:hypothetical protein
VPDLLPVPVGEQAHFPQAPSGWQAMEFDLLQSFAGRRLFSSQSREPDVKRFECTHERFDFAQLAAPCGLAAVQNAKCRLLLSDRLSRKNIDQLKRPLLCHSIAIFTGLRKVISGIEKQHGKVWDSIPKEMRHYHVFGLKTASQANARALIRDEHGFERFFWRKTFQFFRNAIYIHLIGLFPIVLPLYEPQGFR